jgi:hypothetical protein
VSLTALGYILAIAAAGLGWWRWRRELRERRLKALDGARRGLTLHEFVRQLGTDGVDSVLATTVYLVLRQRAKLDEHRPHPNDALAAYFDDGDDVTEFARELMLLLDRAQSPLDAADLAASWKTVGDVALHFSGGARPFLRTVQ